MSKIFAIIAALCLIQVESARFTRETASTLPSISDMAKQAEDALTSIHTKFLEFVGVRSNDELLTVVQERSKTYTDQLQELLGRLGEHAKTQVTKADADFAQLRSSIGQAIEELRAKNPELTSDVQRFEAKFEQSMRNILHNAEHLGNRLKAEGEHLLPDVENIVKQVVTSTQEAATRVIDDLKAPAQQ